MNASTPARRSSALMRRLLAVAMLAVVVAVGAGVAALVVAITSTDTASDAVRWNVIVAVDRRTGEVTILDEDGVRLDRFATDVADPRVHVVGSSHVVLEGLLNDRETIAIVDIGSSDVTELDLEDDFASDNSRDLRVRPVRGADAFTVGDDARPGPAFLVTVDGEIVDIAREARWTEPLVNSQAITATPDGGAVAIVDFSSRPSETAVVSLAELDVVVVDGSLVSLSDDRIRTATRRDADDFAVETFDLSGVRTESFRVDPFLVGLDADDGDLLTASLDGEIRRWSPNGDSDVLAELDVGDGDSLVLTTRTIGPEPTLAVGTTDGEVLFVRSDGELIDDISLDDPLVRFDLGRRCLPAITETSIAVIDTETGAIIAEERVGEGGTAFVGATDDDACTIFAIVNDDPVFGVLAGADDVVEFGARESLAGLSGDGSAYVVRRTAGEIVLRAFGDDGRDDIDLDVGGFASIYFLRR